MKRTNAALKIIPKLKGTDNLPYNISNKCIPKYRHRKNTYILVAAFF